MVCGKVRGVVVRVGTGRGFGRDASGGVGDGLAEGVQEGFGSEMAGDLTGGGSSNAIADDEGAEVGQGGAGVLVGVAHMAAMGEHGEGAEWRRCGGRRKWGSDRDGGGRDLRLERLQSRSICHYGTVDRRFRGSLKQYSLRQ